MSQPSNVNNNHRASIDSSNSSNSRRGGRRADAGAPANNHDIELNIRGVRRAGDNAGQGRRDARADGANAPETQGRDLPEFRLDIPYQPQLQDYIPEQYIPPQGERNITITLTDRFAGLASELLDTHHSPKIKPQWMRKLFRLNTPRKYFAAKNTASVNSLDLDNMSSMLFAKLTKNLCQMWSKGKGKEKEKQISLLALAIIKVRYGSLDALFAARLQADRRQQQSGTDLAYIGSDMWHADNAARDLSLMFESLYQEHLAQQPQDQSQQSRGDNTAASGQVPATNADGAPTGPQTAPSTAPLPQLDSASGIQFTFVEEEEEDYTPPDPDPVTTPAPATGPQVPVSTGLEQQPDPDGRRASVSSDSSLGSNGFEVVPEPEHAPDPNNPIETAITCMFDGVPVSVEQLLAADPTTRLTYVWHLHDQLQTRIDAAADIQEIQTFARQLRRSLVADNQSDSTASHVLVAIGAGRPIAIQDIPFYGIQTDTIALWSMSSAQLQQFITAVASIYRILRSDEQRQTYIPLANLIATIANCHALNLGDDSGFDDVAATAQSMLDGSLPILTADSTEMTQWPLGAQVVTLESLLDGTTADLLRLTNQIVLTVNNMMARYNDGTVSAVATLERIRAAGLLELLKVLQAALGAHAIMSPEDEVRCQTLWQQVTDLHASISELSRRHQSPVYS